jgi:hypothetical protein
MVTIIATVDKQHQYKCELTSVSSRLQAVSLCSAHDRRLHPCVLLVAAGKYIGGAM